MKETTIKYKKLENKCKSNWSNRCKKVESETDGESQDGPDLHKKLYKRLRI